MPTLTIFAGVNGAGKTSLYNQQKKYFNFGERINPDEILTQFNGNWNSENDVTKSSLIALKKMNNLLKNKESFNWETTIVTFTLLSRLSIAKSLGYKIVFRFIGVGDVKTALDRIKFRVANGGHGVDTKTVEQRFSKQFNGLDEVLNYVDKAIFYDNSTKMKVVATYENHSFANIDKSVKWTKNLLNLQSKQEQLAVQQLDK